MKDLSVLERAVLNLLLSGDSPVLATLRAQAASARVGKRDLSGVGFSCSFEVPPDTARVEGRANFELDDVIATVHGLEHGAGFVLFVRDGQLAMLEGFSYGETWPQEIAQFALAYQREPRELALPAPSPS